MSEPRANLVDRVINYFSPGAGIRRAYARNMQALMSSHMGSYEGASKGGRLEGWKAKNTSANAENGPALNILRNRSRDLSRNNPYARRAVEVITNNVVGTGFVLKVAKETPAALKQRFDSLKSDWLNTTACDADGRLDFAGLENLIVRTVVESGECLVRRRPRFAADNLPIPLQLQVMEPDFLDTGKDGVLAESGNRVIQGVEFNRLGQRVAYWLFPEHPGDAGVLRGLRNFESRRVPASDILHIFRLERAGQVRGIPWGASCIVLLKEGAEYRGAQLVRQKIAACYVAFVTGDDTTGTGGTTVDANGKSLPPVENFSPGMIEHLPLGKQVTLATPPGVEGYAEYNRVTNLEVSAGYGVPYEALTGDFGNTNFSSGKIGQLEFGHNLDTWQYIMLRPQFHTGIWPWIMQAMLLPANGVRGIWTPPRRPILDMTKEIPAFISEIRGGLNSWSERVRTLGYDPEELLEQMKEDQKNLDAAGIVLDSDARRPASGAWQLAPDAPVQSDQKKKE